MGDWRAVCGEVVVFNGWGGIEEYEFLEGGEGRKLVDHGRDQAVIPGEGDWRD